MGIDYNAYLGYGAKIDDQELANKASEDTEDDQLVTIWAGDAYSGEMDTFLIIKESKQSSHSWSDQEDPIAPDKLIAKQEWNDKILSWCKDNDITDPKIGWWLCSSVS